MGASRSSHFVLFALLATTAVMAAGCRYEIGLEERYVWQKLPRFCAADAEQVQMTSRPGVYIVAMTEAGQSGTERSGAGLAKSRLIEATSTRLESGESIGFRLDERSHVIAWTRRGQTDLGPWRDELVCYRWVTRQAEAQYALMPADDAAAADSPTYRERRIQRQATNAQNQAYGVPAP